MELKNTQLVESMISFLQQKDSESRQILQQLYLNPKQYEGIFQLLDTQAKNVDDAYLDNATLVNNYLAAAVALDMDITEAIILSKKSGDFYLASRDLVINLDSFQENNQTIMNNMDDMFFGPVITASYWQDNIGGPSRLIYTIAMNIRGSQASKRFNESVGILFINFSVNRIPLANTMLLGDYPGRLLIMTPDGGTLYDSKGICYLSPYSHTAALQNDSTIVDLDERVLLNSRTYDKLSLTIAGLLPIDAVKRETAAVRRVVLMLAFASIIVAVFIFTWSIRFFARRVHVINDAITKLQNGDLSQRIAIDRGNDEISVIAANFNEMCDDLQRYINRVYRAELMQKDAVITALQLQINPHFLYNTLEIIRMEALQGGSVQAGLMIEHLSRMIRSSLNTNLIVSVSEEILACQNYLDLYNIRLHGQVDLSITIGDDLLSYGIVKHMIQPILENAIVHGFSSGTNDCLISITCTVNGLFLDFLIADNGIGIDQSRLHEIQQAMDCHEPIEKTDTIGLSNVDQRLKLLFGDECGITITTQWQSGTEVRMRLPAMKREDMEAYVQRNHR